MAASILDSEAVFTEALEEAKVSAVGRAALARGGICSYGDFAYMSSSGPDGGGEEKFFDELKELYKSEDGTIIPLSPAERAALRRVWAEAHVAATARLRNLMDPQPDVFGPPRVHLQERTRTQEAQQERLRGIRITGTLEPSHALQDKVYQMRQEGVLKYVDPASCTSKDQGSHFQKSDKRICVLDSQGNVRTTAAPDGITADTSSEYRVRVALQRRALAFDQFGLIPYEDHEEW
eukprot:2771581-Amphidinium_carterae.1